MPELSINLPLPGHEALERLTSKQPLPQSYFVEQALLMFDRLSSKTKEGHELLLQGPDGTTETVQFPKF